MEDSILKSTKKILGIRDDYTAFDLDVMTHINSTFAILEQIGIPLSGFKVEDDTLKWSDLSLPQDQLAMIKTYVYLKVRMLFDPPTTSFLIEAMNNQLQEHLYRISYLREASIPPLEVPPIVPVPIPAEGVTYASGTQATPVYVWIMPHNLGYHPAAVRFTTMDEETELEPEEITYADNNRILATWPTPTAGKWMVS